MPYLPCHGYFVSPSVVCSAALTFSKKYSRCVMFSVVMRLWRSSRFVSSLSLWDDINCHYKGMVLVAMHPSIFRTSAWPLLLFVGHVPGFCPGRTKLMLLGHLSWGGAMPTNIVFTGATTTVQPCVAFLKQSFFSLCLFLCACACLAGPLRRDVRFSSMSSAWA